MTILKFHLAGNFNLCSQKHPAGRLSLPKGWLA